jgi:hypothetical protein
VSHYLPSLRPSRSSAASFKVIAAHSFPEVPSQFITPTIYLHQLRGLHDPVILFTHPDSPTITLFNLVNMQPRQRPPFPDDAHLLKDRFDKHIRRDPPDQITGWEITIPASATDYETGSNLMACAMDKSGKTIVGVGHRGSVWVWETRLSSE